MPNEEIPMSKLEEDRLRDLNTTSRYLASAFVIGGLIVCLRFVLPVISSGFAHNGWTATGQTFAALLWGAAWFAVAFVFGFLFGIPKALQTGAKLNSSSATATGSGARHDMNGSGTGSPLKVNTNLEEISDWLTKILVGATLTQIAKIPSSIGAAAKFMAGDGGGIGPVPFAAAIILYFSAIGFFAGYVLTRMFFSLAFSRSDQGLSGVDNIVALAKQSISPDSNAETKEDAYNSIVFSLLYQPPPEGFEKAIQYAEEFLRQDTPTRASLYINLACAYGQKYRYLRGPRQSDQELQQARAGALAAIKEAIEMDPKSKRRFRDLIHPQRGARDNDLEVFASDPEFTNLIDRD